MKACGSPGFQPDRSSRKTNHFAWPRDIERDLRRRGTVHQGTVGGWLMGTYREPMKFSAPSRKHREGQVPNDHPAEQ